MRRLIRNLNPGHGAQVRSHWCLFSRDQPSFWLSWVIYGLAEAKTSTLAVVEGSAW